MASVTVQLGSSVEEEMENEGRGDRKMANVLCSLPLSLIDQGDCKNKKAIFSRLKYMTVTLT